MPIHACTEEADIGHEVAAGDARQLGADLLLDEWVGNVPGAGPHRLGDVGEEVVDAAHADRLEHARSIGIGVRGIGHRRGGLQAVSAA